MSQTLQADVSNNWASNAKDWLETVEIAPQMLYPENRAKVEQALVEWVESQGWDTEDTEYDYEQWAKDLAERLLDLTMWVVESGTTKILCHSWEEALFKCAEFFDYEGEEIEKWGRPEDLHGGVCRVGDDGANAPQIVLRWDLGDHFGEVIQPE